MSEKDPKKLDQLFQQGSEHYDFEYNPEAWQRMETLLDKDKRKRRFIWWWWGALLLFVPAGALWWGNGREKGAKPDTTSIERSIDDREQNGAEQNTSPEQKSEESLTDPAFSTEPETRHNQQPERLKSSTDEIIPASIRQTDKLLQENSTERKAKEKRVFPRPIASVQEQMDHKKEEPPLVEKRNTDKKEVLSADEQNALVTAEDSPVKTDPPDILSPAPYPLLIYRSLLDVKPPERLLNTGQKQSQAEPQNFFLIGLPAGAEVTVVDTEHPTSVDWKTGLQLEYFYQGRYSLSLGANYVRKSYIGGEGAYKPPVGFWTRKIAPQSTTGFCHILEVPVMVGYYPQGMLRSGFFAKAGFTSFFMLKERYYFHYDLPDEDLVKKWYGHNEYRHWFGIGQVSAGYHLRLGKRTSLQLAPYFQIPLTGLGHGKVKLWSMGMQANFSFRVGKGD
jgi:hypothetical protein